MDMHHSEWEALALNDCPVSEELIGQLYRSSQDGIHELVSGLSANRRGSLAAFCYGRAHLRDIGLAIAATCDLETLVAVGGRAGNFLFDQSRELSSMEKRRSWSRHGNISLGPISASRSPMMDDDDDDDDEEVTAD
jgi:hypothetical protein